jgi:hypothetical protein
MSSKYKRVTGWRKWAIMGTMGTAFVLPIGNCNVSEFSTTTTTTLSAAEVVTYLVRSWLITPIDDFVTERVQNFFSDDDE